jgi:hypothetical protein
MTSPHTGSSFNMLRVLFLYVALHIHQNFGGQLSAQEAAASNTVTLELALAILDFIVSENGRFLREPLIRVRVFDYCLLILLAYIFVMHCYCVSV